MKVTLTNSNNEFFELEYEIRDHLSAQIWAGCIARAHKSGLNEKNRFANFPTQAGSEIDNLIEALEHNLNGLRETHPKLVFPKIDLKDLQGSVNTLHTQFAHRHEDGDLENDYTKNLWREFNVLLHAVEAVLESKSITKYSGGLGITFGIFTWNNPELIEIPEESFADFEIGKHFGVAYINYAHVGRHLLEMYYSKDDQLADTHIVPASQMSADTMLWFGPTDGHYTSQSLIEKLRIWFEERAKRFEKLGLYWGDPKLALGYIPVARLKQQFYTSEEAAAFVEKIAKFDTFADVRVN
jgi:hypothetical protein